MQKYTKPMDIERRSFEIIEQELTTKIPDKYKPIVKRVIHTTADFSYETNLVFSESAVDVALSAIGNGTAIVTDTNMAKAGINKKAAQKNGCEICCYMADEDVAESAAASQTTRAVASVRKAAGCNPDCIYVVGNAPTALYEILRLYEEKKFFPKLVIGVPVGFVNVVEAKEDIIASDIPYIVARGRKGGSNVAAAIVNALMYMSLGEDRK
jgi:precorrin-8X/cobalt-precorrin-8 methylmutase